jgi:hypothetical protein
MPAADAFLFVVIQVSPARAEQEIDQSDCFRPAQPASKDVDPDAGPVADPLECPGIGTIPPVGVSTPIVDAESFMRQDVHRYV